MAGNIIKLVITLLVGYFFGFVAGMVLGAFVGAIPGLFFHEIVNSNGSIFMSIALLLILGVLNGIFATLLVNKFLDGNVKLRNGVLFGLTVGFTSIFFVGIISVASFGATNYQYYLYPVLYSGIAGSRMGEIIFPVIGTIRVVQSIFEDRKKATENEEHLKATMMFLRRDTSDKEKRG
jgi:hypothetical protein